MGTGRGRSAPRPLLTVPNVTAHPLTASVPVSILLHNGALLYGFNVPIKGLTCRSLCCAVNTPLVDRNLMRELRVVYTLCPKKVVHQTHGDNVVSF